MIIRQPLSRRTMLRGLGTVMALPLFEAMIPTAKAAEVAARTKRLQIFYSPNGMIMPQFIPKQTGANFVLSPTLASLAPHRNDITVITGLAHKNANSLGDGGGAHGRACGAFLTGAHPKPTEGFDLRCGLSMDQAVANSIGESTQVASLEIGLEQASSSGSCDVGFSCAYTNGLSWRNPTVPLPVTANPRDVFERLFGDGDAMDETTRIAKLRRQSSILDFVMEDASRLSSQLGAGDKHKLAEFMEATRDVEKRIQLAMRPSTVDQSSEMARPAGIPESFQDHARIMIDLQILAMQADITRVASFMLGREISNRTYPEIGVPDSHHMLSHHGHDPQKIAKLAKINAYHMEQFAHYLTRMKETRDGDGTLLDSTLVLRGSSFGDPNDHDNMDLPIIIAGGKVPGNRHIAVVKDTPMANLLVTAMNLMNVPTKQFGDSTGPLKELALA
jgi:hypothetical protein